MQSLFVPGVTVWRGEFPSYMDYGIERADEDFQNKRCENATLYERLGLGQSYSGKVSERCEFYN